MRLYLWLNICCFKNWFFNFKVSLAHAAGSYQKIPKKKVDHISTWQFLIIRKTERKAQRETGCSQMNWNHATSVPGNLKTHDFHTGDSNLFIYHGFLFCFILFGNLILLLFIWKCIVYWSLTTFLRWCWSQLQFMCSLLLLHFFLVYLVRYNNYGYYE